jgi:ammonia channel protein AmtB
MADSPLPHSGNMAWMMMSTALVQMMVSQVMPLRHALLDI